MKEQGGGNCSYCPVTDRWNVNYNRILKEISICCMISIVTNAMCLPNLNYPTLN